MDIEITKRNRVANGNCAGEFMAVFDPIHTRRIDNRYMERNDASIKNAHHCEVRDSVHGEICTGRDWVGVVGSSFATYG